MTKIADNYISNVDLNKIADQIYQANREKGFGNRNLDIGKGLMLIVGELSEAMEADRADRYADVDSFHTKFKDREEDLKVKDADWDKVFSEIFESTIKDTYEDEVADALIRIFDWAGRKGIDLNFHVKQKLRYNKTRPHKHGEKKY